MKLVHPNVPALDVSPAPLSFDIDEIVAYMREIGSRPRALGRSAGTQSPTGW